MRTCRDSSSILARALHDLATACSRRALLTCSSVSALQPLTSSSSNSSCAARARMPLSWCGTNPSRQWVHLLLLTHSHIFQSLHTILVPTTALGPREMASLQKSALMRSPNAASDAQLHATKGRDVQRAQQVRSSWAHAGLLVKRAASSIGSSSVSLFATNKA